MQIRYLLLIMLAALTVACSGPEHKLLERADSVIIDHPDSAMAILGSIDPQRLKGDDLPYYALLLTQAQVETGMSVSSDSLISIAYERYGGDSHGDKGIRSGFYLGETYYNQSKGNDLKTYIKGTDESKIEVSRPLRLYLNAYEEAKRQGNDYWIARAAKRVKIYFCWIENFYEGERYAREVTEHFKKAGREKDHRIAIIDHASLYEPLEKFDIERDVLDSLRAVLLKENPVDSTLIIRIDYELSHMERAMEHLKEQGFIFLSSEDVRKQVEKSGNNLIWFPPRSVILNNLKGYIYPSKDRRDLQMEITEARRDYYDSITLQNAENAVMFQRLLWIAVIVFLTIIVILCRMFYFRYKAQKARLATNLESFLSLRADADRMAEEIEKRSDTISRLQVQMEEKSRIDCCRDDLIRNLLKEKWGTLVMLCDQLFDVGQSDLDRKRVIRNIEKELKKVMSAKSVAETVDAVDKYMGGIVSRLREQCTFLKEEDINFLGLIYAGFSVRAVCMFTGIEYQHFYVKKSRLLKRIQNSDAIDKDLFVEGIQKKQAT